MSSPFPFVVFALAVAILYQAWTSAAWRQAVLLVSSLVCLFSFSLSWQAYIPLAAFLTLGYAGLRWTLATPKAFMPALVALLAVFIWLKQYAFVPGAWLLPFPYVTIGLSYICFRVLHLIIAARYGALPNVPGAVSYFLYTANFLTLASGPIQLYPDYVKSRDLAASRRVSVEEIAEALERIIKGLFKTNVLALIFSTLRTHALSAVTDSETAGMKMIAATVTFAAYPLFLYCNFSGFIDLVIGAGGLLGWKLPENFNRPFAADNFMEFWSNRWHITLSSWLKTYVYNPLLIALMRRGFSPAMEPFLGVLAFFVTFFLVGIWHGQTQEMLLYGVLLGLGVSINKLFQVLLTKRLGRKRYNALSSGALYTACSRGLTFAYVALTLVLFWSNWKQMREMQASLGAASTWAVCGVIVLGSTAVIAMWESVRSHIINGPWNEVPFSQFVRTTISTALLVALLAISLLMNQPAPDIIYKGF